MKQTYKKWVKRLILEESDIKWKGISLGSKTGKKLLGELLVLKSKNTLYSWTNPGG